jgi:hypothetical protein
VRWHILAWIISALLSMSLATAQVVPSGAPRPGAITQIMIDGKRITGPDVVVRNGVAYVSVPALAQTLGASVSSKRQTVLLSLPAAPEVQCEGIPSAWKLSDAYRKAAVRLPDTIESLRAMVNKATANKHVAVIPIATFDEVDRQISEADFHAQTDADKSVSYALSKANNILAIMYLRLWRGVPAEFAKQGQLDSVLCSMESKFALQGGRLSGRETCSVFHFNNQEAEAKPVESN